MKTYIEVVDETNAVIELPWIRSWAALEAFLKAEGFDNYYIEGDLKKTATVLVEAAHLPLGMCI